MRERSAGASDGGCVRREFRAVLMVAEWVRQHGVTSGGPRLDRSRSSRALTAGSFRCSMRHRIAVHLGEEARDSVRSNRHADRCEQLADEAQ